MAQTAGFGKTKAAQEAAKEDATPSHAQVDVFKALQMELDTPQENLNSHTFMGIIGHENTTKTAIVTSAHTTYAAQIEKPKELWIIDFDGGGAANKSAFHPDNTAIKIWEPYIYMSGDRTAYNYADTHQRVMRILQFAVKKADTVWGVLVTGTDQWDSVCINNMRINDLGLAKDGIEAADNRGAGTGQRVEYQWDWALRKSRFQQLTALSQGLVKKGVKVFLETHLSLTNYTSNNEANAQWRPAWEKSTNNFLFQILKCEREDTFDDEGNVVKQTFTGVFEKSKTNASIQGQKRTILITEIGKEPIWYGLPELNDGTL